MRRLAAGALLVLLGPSASAAQDGGTDCPWAGPAPARIGIERLLCRGGWCEINVRDEDGVRLHRFSTEPVIQELAADAVEGPAEGDVIVAVDGALITTREGGRRLANLVAGVPVRLRVRRNGRSLEVLVTPVPGCPTGGLSVRVPG